MTMQAKLANWEARAMQNWRRLVSRAASGEEITEEELMQAAALAGRSAKQFAADLALQQSREDDAKRSETAEETLDLLRSEAKELSADEAEFKAWREQCNAEAEERASAIRERKERLSQQQTEAARIRDDAIARLRQTSDTELSEQEQALMAESAATAASVAYTPDARRRLAINNKLGAERRVTLQEIRESKLKPENFALSSP